MAHFYGTVHGNRGEASRLGTRDSGLRSTAASWQGAVTTTLYDQDGVDFARVSLTRWRGKGIHKIIYEGPVSGAGVFTNEAPE
jgi:hypothetical protein